MIKVPSVKPGGFVLRSSQLLCALKCSCCSLQCACSVSSAAPCVWAELSYLQCLTLEVMRSGDVFTLSTGEKLVKSLRCSSSGQSTFFPFGWYLGLKSCVSAQCLTSVCVHMSEAFMAWKDTFMVSCPCRRDLMSCRSVQHIRRWSRGAVPQHSIRMHVLLTDFCSLDIHSQNYGSTH